MAARPRSTLARARYDRAVANHRPTAKSRFRGRRSGSLASLAQILDGAYPGRREDKPLLRTFSWWDHTVSERIARNARPVKLANGTLVIHTSTASWAQELSFFEADLLASVRKKVPAVRRLRIYMGPMPPAPTRPDPPAVKVLPIEIGELPGDIARALARVGDDSLREALTRAVCTCLAPVPEERKLDTDRGARKRR